MSKGWIDVEPRKRPAQRRSRETVEFVLEAATQLFGELGYSGTTTNKVAERAGVSIGSLYQYFPNKDSLVLELAERHISGGESALEEFTARLREEEPPVEVFVRTFVGAFVGFHRSEPLLHRVLYEDAPRTPALRKRLAGLEARISSEVEYHLVRLGVGGADPGLKAAMLTHLVDSLVHGVVIHPTSSHTLDECTQEVVNACLGYLGYAQQIGGVGNSA